jgi:hypothetical protein
MSYDIDEFVNFNKINVEINGDLFEHDEELMTDQFESDLTFDKINAEASPVLIYELNTKAVAWYDIEMYCGYKS